MQPLTLSNPTPGTTTTRTRIEPQPPANAREVFAWLGEGVPVDVPQARHGLYCRTEDGLHFLGEAPHAPGEYWVRESLRGVIDTKIISDETMPICACSDGPHIWTEDKAREPWRWGERPTIPAEEMPREFCRYTARVSVAVEKVDGEWFWVTTFYVRGK